MTVFTECIGTAVLVTAYSLNIQSSGMGLAMIYMILIIVLYPLGGAHLNPALTLGQLIATKSSNLTIFCMFVIIAQFVGGMIGMTFSMLFRAVGTTTVVPGFASSNPPQNAVVADP